MRHWMDLAERADRENRYCYSDFLSQTEVQTLLAHRALFSAVGFTLYGGTEDAERQVARFGAFGYEEPFPIACMKIAPRQQKFSSALTHRDFLGSLLHLGIERAVLGDIVVRDNVGYVFCLAHVVPILTELERVRDTSVTCTLTEEIPAVFVRTEERECSVSSLRLDCVLAGAYALSRREAADAVEQKRVFRNGVLCTSAGKEVEPGDVVTVRGKGKFRMQDVSGLTRKGKYRIRLEQYL